MIKKLSKSITVSQFLLVGNHYVDGDDVDNNGDDDDDDEDEREGEAEDGAWPTLTKSTLTIRKVVSSNNNDDNSQKM